MPCAEPGHDHVWPAQPLDSDLIIEECERACGWCDQTFLVRSNLFNHAQKHVQSGSKFGIKKSSTHQKDIDNPIGSASVPLEKATAGMEDTTSLNSQPAKANQQMQINNNGFNLVPSIFVPFHGISSTDPPPPKDRDSKLKRMLEDLDKHHDSVRRNMIYLIHVQKEKLISQARDLAKLEINEDPGTVHPESANRGSSNENEMRKILKSMKTAGLKGTNGHEYEYEERDLPNLDSYSTADNLNHDAEGDATMSGMDIIQATTSHTAPTPTPGPSPMPIRQQLNAALQELTLRSTAELEGYDKHADAVKDYYQKALERHIARERDGFGGPDATAGADSGATTTGAAAAAARPGSNVSGRGGGILKTPKENWNVALGPQGDLPSSMQAPKDPRRRDSTDVGKDRQKDQRRVSFDVGGGPNPRRKGSLDSNVFSDRR